MKTELIFSIKDCNDKPLGRTKHAEDAAALVALHGTHARVKVGNLIVWYEGIDGSAGDSYDGAAALMLDRIRRGKSPHWGGTK